MNKTAIGLLFIVIVIISVLSYLLLSKCPVGKERKGFKCVDKLPSTTTSRSGLVRVATGCTASAPFKDGNSCVSSCPVGKVADAAENCIIPRQIIPMAGKNTACPDTHQLKEYGTCVNACAPGLFKDNTAKECVQVCPSVRPVLHNGECLASCPSGMFRDLSNGVTPICVSACPTARPANGNNCQSCRERVPSLVNNNGQCATSCPAGTFRNDISMCVPINSLAYSSITRTQIDAGSSPNIASNITDGNWSSLYNSTSTNPTWVYFQNISKQGQMLYGFTIKFGSASGTNNINLKMYNNNTSLTDANKIFDETISNVGSEVTIRRNISPARSVNNLYLLFDRKVLIHEFEVTVR